MSTHSAGIHVSHFRICFTSHSRSNPRHRPEPRMPLSPRIRPRLKCGSRTISMMRMFSCINSLKHFHGLSAIHLAANYASHYRYNQRHSPRQRLRPRSRFSIIQIPRMRPGSIISPMSGLSIVRICTMNSFHGLFAIKYIPHHRPMPRVRIRPRLRPRYRSSHSPKPKIRTMHRTRSMFRLSI